MSNNKKLFEEAIADAKALREAAVANAKAALEESFAPRISAMFEERMRDLEEGEDETNEIYKSDRNLDLVSMNEKDEMEEMYDLKRNTSMEEEIDLEELFNSLEEEDSMYEMDSELSEEEDYEEQEDEVDGNFDLEEILRELEEESLEENEDTLNEMFDEAATGSEGIGEVTVDELRDIIRAELSAAGLGEEGMEGEEGEEEMDMDLEMGDEELEGEETEEEGEEKKPKKKKSDEEELEELYSLYEAMKSKKKDKKEMDEAKKAGTSGGVAPHKNISSFSAAGKYKGPKVIKEEEKDDVKESMKSKIKAMMERRKGVQKENMEKEELNEAIRTIKTLRGQLNEVNLLNAKLIYVNRIFKASNLNEGQKVNVVNSFDKATTLNEAKNVYEILKTTIKKSSNKKSLTESKTSFASKVIGGRPASQPIIQADDQISRMQKLAGIK
jgi:hypothetical protein